jgi:hypothetical protein
MWDYSDRRDSTHISSDELREAEIDECVRAVTNIKKKSPVPKVFGAWPLARPFPAPRYASYLGRVLLLFHNCVD